jgi:BlaI family transcriptional regulator, penicillinase repressor
MEYTKPTDAELDILHILWTHGAQSVRFVNEKLNRERDSEVGYTTTLKTMQVMHDKRLLTRDDSQRSHVYAAAMPQNDMQSRLVNQFVSTAFKGSAMQMVMQALGNHTATSDEIAEIRALIEQKEKEL